LRSTTCSGSREIARRAGARLVVVHVETPPVMALLTPDQPWPIQETMAQRTDDLRTLVEADGRQQWSRRRLCAPVRPPSLLPT
jgi:hypothetical protein